MFWDTKLKSDILKVCVVVGYYNSPLCPQADQPGGLGTPGERAAQLHDRNYSMSQGPGQMMAIKILLPSSCIWPVLS